MQIENKRDKKRRAMLVVGMYRSGTSAATRIVNLLGADMLDNLLSLSQDNLLGYWKSVDLNLS